MRRPLPERYLTALSPSAVSGTFTTTLAATWASSWPSLIMPSKSVATTSRLTSPGTIEQISSTSGRNARFSLAASDGLVVTPSTTPSATPSLISLTLAVSRKIFMRLPSCGPSYRFYRNAGSGPHRLEGARVAGDPPDDGHGAGRPDLVALAHGRAAEEDAERLAGRPVAEVAERDRVLRGVGGRAEREAEVDLVAPGIRLGGDRELGGDGGGRARVVQLAGRADATGGDPDRPRHLPTWGPRNGPHAPMTLGAPRRSRSAPREPASHLPDGLLDRLVERGQPALDVLAEVHAQHAPAALGQHAEVAAGLGGLDDAERVLVTRHRHVGRVVGGDHEED